MDKLRLFVQICMLSLWRRYDKKLRRIILLHFLLITFRLMGESENPHFHDFGISGRAPEPQNQSLFIFSEHMTPQICQEKPESFWANTSFANLRMLEMDLSKTFEKTGTEKTRRPVQQILENLGYGINIFQNT